MNDDGYAPPDGKKDKPSTDALADLHREAIKHWNAAEEVERPNRLAALDDIQFRAGEQWDAKAQKERTDDGRPCLTINRMPQFIRQVTGDIRQNKPSIKVRPVEDADVGLAEVYTGLIRHIEQQSDADTAYITAADGAAGGGIGHFRVNTEYEYEDSFDQCLKIKRILNPLAVLWDPLAQEIDRSDANFCFVLDRISKSDFKARYPDATVSDFDGSHTSDATTAHYAEWFNDDSVRIAEYWVKKATKKKIGLFADGSVHELDSDEAKALGKPEKTREAESYKICSYIISGAEVLEGPQEWMGKYIPIVPVIGEEVSIGDRIVRHGLVRFAKDPQRAFNYMRSASVEAIALQPKAPFMVTVDQIKGLQGFWDNAGKKNFPYLPFHPDAKTGGVAPQRVQPAVSATGMMEEAALAADDMKAVTGIYDAALGAKSNETSGKAILARDRQGDTGTYVYIDNLSKGIAHCGRILVDLIPKVYDTERVIRTLGEDGTEAAYIINKMMVNEQNEQIRVAERIPEPKERNRPGAQLEQILMRDDAKYDVAVSTGPSYATKRVEAADSMLQLVQAVPQVGAVAADLIVKNLDMPGGEQMAKRLQKMLPPGIDEDNAEPPPPPPDPALIKLEMEQKKAEMDMEFKRLDAELKQQQAAMEMELEQQRMAMEERRAQMEMQIAREKADLEIQLMMQKANAALEIESARAESSIRTSEAKAEHDAALRERQAEREPAKDSA